VRAWAESRDLTEAAALFASDSVAAIARAPLATCVLGERLAMEIARTNRDASLLPFVASTRSIADAVRVYAGASSLDGPHET
jgi:hypothetical protein